MMQIADIEEILIPEMPVGWKPKVEYFSAEFNSFVAEHPVDGGKIAISFPMPIAPNVLSIETFEATRNELHQVVWQETHNPQSEWKVSVQ